MPENPKRPRRKFRLRHILAALLVVVLAIYSAVWYHLSGKLATQAAAAIAQENRNGKRASCENLASGGFPLGLGITCDSILFEDDGAGMSLSAGELQSAMHVYAPLVVKTNIASPAHLEYPGLLPMDFKWESLATNIRLGAPLPAEISILATNLQAFGQKPAGPEQVALFTLHLGKADLRPEGNDLEFAATIRSFSARIGKTKATLDADAGIRIIDGVQRIVTGAKDLRGASAEIHNLSMTTSDGGTIALSGPVSIDNAGYVNGQISLEVDKAEALAANLAEIAPGAAAQIGTLIGLVAPPQNGSTGRMEIRIIKGRIYAGLFAIGKIPPILPDSGR
jgi:hypothetical protein